MSSEIISHYSGGLIRPLGRPYVISAAFQHEDKICGEVFPFLGGDKQLWSKAERLCHDPKGQEIFALDLIKMNTLLQEKAYGILDAYLNEKADERGDPALASANINLMELTLPPFHLQYLDHALFVQFLNYVIGNSQCEQMKAQLRFIRSFRADLRVVHLDASVPPDGQ